MSDPRNYPLYSGFTYHIYNQGNNKENLFREETNYHYFLEKLHHYILPIADIYAYCLLPNHFHLLLQFKSNTDLLENFLSTIPIVKKSQNSIENQLIYNKAVSKILSNQFRDFFGTYTKAFNKKYNRKGKLFSLPFKRQLVETIDYFNYLIIYIHRNPIHHGFSMTYEEWEFTSYSLYFKDSNRIINIEKALDYIDPLDEFKEMHEGLKNYTK